jgi:histidinol-phosphate phosphatase family protein
MTRHEEPGSALRPTDYDIVIPTIGRSGLTRLLASIATSLNGPDPGPAPRRVIVVDDRPDADAPLKLPATELPVVLVRCGGRGPGASRNRGWWRSDAPWVCFLDDDVEVRPDWSRRLSYDLEGVGADVAAVQARVHVPMPTDRRPTDRERNVGGLATATWITADMAVRRNALTELGGFDERFPRAYREDSDLALRLLDAGWRLEHGRREVDHPVGAAPWTASIRAQRGNADDALMRRLHGAGWRERADAPGGALRQHVAATATAGGAVGAVALGRRGLAALLGVGWLVQAARFAVRRIVPGPRTVSDVAAMAVTSVALQPVAARWATQGWLRARRLAPAGPADRWGIRRPALVLFDRDGTLVEDVPYNGDPAEVAPVEGARYALDRLRRAGIAVGMVSNQSGVARGLLTAHDVDAVNARVVELLGSFDTIQWCPHGPDDRCARRKPSSGMVEAAAAELGLPGTACAVVGDIGSDVEAGLGVGARTVLVPTAVTRAEEVTAAPEVAGSLVDAVDGLLHHRRLPAGHQVAPRERSVDLLEERVP